MSLEESFGLVLKSLREQRNISQEALGFESGMHRTYISLLERGKKGPSLNTIFKLARPLDIRASEIVSRVEQLLESTVSSE